MGYGGTKACFARNWKQAAVLRRPIAFVLSVLAHDDDIEI